MKYLSSSLITTPLGDMVAIADEKGLYLLLFSDQKNFHRKLQSLIAKGFEIRYESNSIINSISQELEKYFAGTLKNFETPFHLLGTSFQQNVSHILAAIPYSAKYTYAKQATILGNKKAYRAVATANGSNMLAIIIPCHRVIASNGKLCGYAGGIWRKQWLIEHEEKYHQ